MPERRRIVCCAVVFTAVAVSPALAQVSTCTVENAVYEPVSKDVHGEGGAYQATFRRQTQSVANEAPFVMTMRESKTGLQFEFSFFQPNGYVQTIVRQRSSVRTDKQEEMQDDKQEDEDSVPGSTALFFDKGLATIAPLFDRRLIAPAFMLFPDLGKAFWYGHIAERRFVPPAGMWKLSACSR